MKHASRVFVVGAGVIGNHQNAYLGKISNRIEKEQKMAKIRVFCRYLCLCGSNHKIMIDFDDQLAEADIFLVSDFLCDL